MISPTSLAAFSTPTITPLPRQPEVAGKITVAAVTAAARPGSGVPPSNAPMSRTSPRGSLLDLSV